MGTDSKLIDEIYEKIRKHKTYDEARKKFMPDGTDLEIDLLVLTKRKSLNFY